MALTQLAPFRAWRIDYWDSASARAQRSEYVTEAQAREFWDYLRASLSADDASHGAGAMLLRRARADLATRRSGASVWNVVEEI